VIIIDKIILNKKNYSLPNSVEAQGAIEYLLLLAAAIVVVAIVITFLMSTLNQGTETGGTETYEFLCITTKSSTDNCQCYRAYKNDSLDEDTLTNVDVCCSNEDIAKDLKKLMKCNN
jgi:uncharacterized protein (UPF0333 family)